MDELQCELALLFPKIENKQLKKEILNLYTKIIKQLQRKANRLDKTLEWIDKELKKHGFDKISPTGYTDEYWMGLKEVKAKLEGEE